MRTVTVAELGQQLPIGILKNGKLEKDFALRPFKSWVDRQLSAYREAHAATRHHGHLLAKYISLMAERVGSETFPLTAERNSMSEMEARVLSWNFADVIYMYLYSRVQLSDKIRFPYACPNVNCKQKNGVMQASLNDIEVRVIDDPKELTQWIQLRDGFKISDGRTVKKVRLHPVSYNAQLTASGASGLGSLTYHVFRESVDRVDCVDTPYILRNEEIDEISRYDMITIDRQAEVITAGPKISTAGKCPSCGVEIENMINWSFDDFFGSSIQLEGSTN
jgi:hypothetical protein